MERRIHTRLLSVLALSVAFASACEPLPPEERYPGPWVEDFNPKLSLLLIQNGIRGCGDLVYKPAYDNTDTREEYLIYCSNGDSEFALVAFFPSNRLTGPARLVPEIPVPARWRE